MIERPKKSVTRFFVPLIDVLILLFCIFLLMPFFGQPDASDNSDASKAALDKAETEPLPQDVQTLQRDLRQARRALKDLEAFRSHVADRVNLLVVYIDANDGKLFYYRDKERVAIPDQRTAEDVIDRHKRLSGTKLPVFLILQPPPGGPGFPTYPQREEYKSWFKGVQFSIN